MMASPTSPSNTQQGSYRQFLTTCSSCPLAQACFQTPGALQESPLCPKSHLWPPVEKWVRLRQSGAPQSSWVASIKRNLLHYNTTKRPKPICPCRDVQSLFIINKALKYVSEWSEQNGLNLNANKCVQCTFSLIGNAVTDPDLNATINDTALSTVDTVTYLSYLLTQSRPIMLRDSLENAYGYPFLQRNFEGYQHLLSIFDNFLSVCYTYNPLLSTSHFSWTS